jgi:hypothetical protein
MLVRNIAACRTPIRLGAFCATEAGAIAGAVIVGEGEVMVAMRFDATASSRPNFEIDFRIPVNEI